MSGYTLSIDYGTTASVGVVASAGGCEVLELSRSRYLPSLVLLDVDGELLVGTSAVNQAVLNPERVCATPKRLVGRPAILLGGEAVEVHRAIGAVLARLGGEAARRFGGGGPERLVLTHPALWADERVEVLRAAARDAGLPEPELVSEPVAAAAHYANGSLGEGAHVAVYDLGGGTFDAAVLRRLAGGGFEVAGRPGGDPNLGGEDFDNELRELVEGHAARIDPEAFEAAREGEDASRLWGAFRREVRQAKEALSDELKYPLVVPGLRDPVLVARRELEALLEPQVQRTIEQLAATIADAGLAPKDLDAIYLTGGSSSIPLVSTLISQELGVTPQTWGDPKAVVALGAVSAATSPRPARARSAESGNGESPPTFRARVLSMTDAPVIATIVCDVGLEGAVDRIAGLLEATPVKTSYGDVRFRSPESPDIDVLAGRIGLGGEIRAYLVGDEQLIESIRATHGTSFGPHESYLMVHAEAGGGRADLEPFVSSLCAAISGEASAPAPPAPIKVVRRVELGVPGRARGFCAGLVCGESLDAVNARVSHVLRGAVPEVEKNPPGLAWELAIGRTDPTPPGEWQRHAQARFHRQFDLVIVGTDTLDGPTTIRVAAIRRRPGGAAPSRPEFDALVDGLVVELTGAGSATEASTPDDASDTVIMTTREARFGQLGAYSLEHPCTLTLTPRELRVDTPADSEMSSFQIAVENLASVLRKAAGEFHVQQKFSISRERGRELGISTKPIWWRLLVPPEEGNAWASALLQVGRGESGGSSPAADDGEVVLFKQMHWLRITNRRFVLKGLLGNVKADVPVDQILSFKGSGVDTIRVVTADGRMHKFNPGIQYKGRTLRALEDATGKRRQ